MNRIFVDMDGPIVDFAGYMQRHGLTSSQVKRLPGAYAAMLPVDGAIESIRRLIGMGYEVWVATKPPTGLAFAYAEKAAWIFARLQELKRRVIITHDKGLLGDSEDFLIDDHPDRANCRNFPGTLLCFGHAPGSLGWPEIVSFFSARARR